MKTKLNISKEQLDSDPQLKQLLKEAIKREQIKKRRPYCPQKPTEKQLEALNHPAKEILYGGAGGGGKTSWLLMGALQYVNVPGYSALIIGKSYKDLSKPGAIMDRCRSWLAGTDAQAIDGGMQWRFPSGAIISFGHLEDKNAHLSFKSAEYQYIAFDELTQFPEEQYLFLRSRCRKVHGIKVPDRLRSASNPGGAHHDWVYNRFVNPDTRNPNCVYIPAKVNDNPHINQADYLEMLAGLDPITRAQMRDGIWVRDSAGLLYEIDWDKAVVNKLEPLQHEDTWQLILGIDYGLKDDTALTLIAFAASCPRVYVIRSEKLNGKSPTEVAQWTKSWIEDCKAQFGTEPHRVVADTQGLGAGYADEAIKTFRLPIEPAKKENKRGYIKVLAGAFADNKIMFLKRGTEQLRHELKNLYWEDDRMLKEHPTSINHCADSLLYAYREVTEDWDYEDYNEPTAKEMRQKSLVDAMDPIERQLYEEAMEEEWVTQIRGFSWD